MKKTITQVFDLAAGPAREVGLDCDRGHARPRAAHKIDCLVAEPHPAPLTGTALTLLPIHRVLAGQVPGLHPYFGVKTPKNDTSSSIMGKNHLIEGAVGGRYGVLW
jgi:hypothetical protein